MANTSQWIELFGGDFKLIFPPGNGCTNTVAMPLEQKQES